MKARIRKNQKDWHVYIFWILLGVFELRDGKKRNRGNIKKW